MIYQIFREALCQHPEAIALINSKGQQWTYSQLDQTIQQWAHYLYELGIEPQDRVAVLLENEDFHVPIFLAIERLNASYIPLDQDIPAQQLAQDLKRLAPKRCLRDADFFPEVLEKIEQYPAQFQTIPYHDQGFEKITYWVSSSGTTGEKKWIPILGEGLNHWAKQLRELMQLKPNDKVLATRSPAYDARIFEYLEAFACGSTLCLIDRNQRKDFQAIINTCEKYQITSLLFIASQFGESNLDDLLRRFKQAQLKHLLVTGDACSVQLKQLCEKHQIFLWNCYGPTEATFGYSILCVNGLDLWLEGRLSCVPIGKAWGNEVRHHIIDEKLYIESPYLSPGYLNSEQDSHYFIEKLTQMGKVRLFDTQDRFVEQEGYLYYLGRFSLESHCKINGVKVTPDFIEACINDYNCYNPLMQIQAAVVIKNYLHQAKPFAYVVVSADFDKANFHTYLKEHLKVEEMPIIIPLATIPRMQPSAKINRQALISREDDLDAWLSDLPSAEAKSIDSTIEEVRTIWKKLFRRHTIPHDVEFLFLGGTSLTAVEMVRQIQVRLDPSYSYQRLLQLQTITVQNIAQSLHLSNPCIEEEKALIQPLLREKNSKEITPLFFLPALLGEGYFSYRELAKQAFINLQQPMYGLSDPGILNEAWLPKSMDHAVSRYIAAIKTIQPKGPYELLGFSFGCTLVYEVAKRLFEQGEQIKQLHLIDSFSPMVYQALNDEDRITLLQALLHFLLPIFNNAFYAEKLIPAHVESGFSRLSKQLKNPQSQRLLAIAERHLEFMQQVTLPEEPLPYCPILYFTKRDQTYLNVINQIGVSKSSSDYRFYGWNRYFRSVRRSGIELDCEHLGALKTQHSPHLYWIRAHQEVFTCNIDFHGPQTSYHWQTQGEQWQLNVYFLSPENTLRMEKKLRNLQLEPIVYRHEKETQRGGSQQRDNTLYTIATLMCIIPNDLKAAINEWVDEAAKPFLIKKSAIPTHAYPKRLDGASEAIDLRIFYERSIYMILTFHVDVTSNIVKRALRQQSYIPTIDAGPNHPLTYSLHLDTRLGAFDAMDKASKDIAHFVSIIQPALQVSSAQKQNYPKRSTFFHRSYLNQLCKKYKLPDQSSASLEKGLRNAANNNQLADIKLFLTSDIDINAPDQKQHKTALYWATTKGWNDCAQYLQIHGATI